MCNNKNLNKQIEEPPEDREDLYESIYNLENQLNDFDQYSCRDKSKFRIFQKQYCKKTWQIL